MKNPAVDTCIERSAEFARPILAHIRALMHRARPEIAETIKWGVPCFEHEGIVAMMAAFKRHASFGFWSKTLLKDRLGKDADRMFPKNAERGMGARKLRSLSDLPPDALMVRTIKSAVALNADGNRPKRKLSNKAPVKPPPYLVAALKKNVKARRTFAGFTPTRQREYVEWLTEAKQESTRKKRLVAAIEWLAEGKPRHWKYQNC